MCEESKRRVAVNNSKIEEITVTRVHLISKSLILLLFIFACFELILPSDIIADETNSLKLGLYKDGEKVIEWEDDIDPSVFNNFDNLNKDLSPLARKYMEYVKKNDNYYQQPSFVFSRLVTRCKELIGKINSDNLDVNSPEAKLLESLIPKIKESHDSMLEAMEKAENELRSTDPAADISPEHDAEMKRVKDRAGRLVELLESCQLALEQNDNAMYNNYIKALSEHFDKMDADHKKYLEAKPRISPKPVIEQRRELLPVKSRNPESMPHINKKKKSGIILDVPGPEFLEQTIDVQFTDDITALAEELNHNPAKIYKYVRDNFDFDVYIGSRKGSQQTLDERAGNDYDLASLLIALLRVSGYHAGYDSITIEIPGDRFCNWLGVDDPDSAIDLLGTEGYQIDWDEQGSIATLRWIIVAAYLPDVNYRGADNDSNSRNWILLDPTFKQYQYGTAINMLDELHEPFNVDDFIESYYSGIGPVTPLERFQQTMLDYLAQYHPGAVYDDMIRTRSIIEETDEILPGTLPYPVVECGVPYAEIPDNMRYKIRFRVSKWYDVLSYTTSVPEIAGKQITMSYDGGGQQHIIDDCGGLYNYPFEWFSQLTLVPVLNIDGCVVDMGQGVSWVGEIITVIVDFFPPQGAPIQNTESIETYIGDYVGIGLNTGGTVPFLFDDPLNECPEPYAGQVLHQTAMSYLNSSKAHDDEFRKLLHTKSSRDISVAFTFNDISLYGDYYLEGYVWEGIIISSSGGSEHGVSTDLECSDYEKEYNRLSGADGSIGENRVFEDYFSGVEFYAEAISAIKALQITNDRQLPICEIVNGLDQDCPHWRDYCPDPYESQINAFVNQYLANYDIVYMPEAWNVYGADEAWEGYGMLALDNTTGRSAYGLAGFMIPHYPHHMGESEIKFSDGGATICRWRYYPFPDFFCTSVSGDITIDPPSPGDLYCAEREDYLTFTVQHINYFSRPGTDLECDILGVEDNRQFRVPYTIKQIADDPEGGTRVYTFTVGVYLLNGLCDKSCQTAQKSFTIFKSNLGAADLYGPVTEWDEDAEGAFVHFNIDDDDLNDSQDKDEDGPITGENDLCKVTLCISEPFETGVATLERSDSKLRVWSDSKKGTNNKILVDANTFTWDLSDFQQRTRFLNCCTTGLWVEGYNGGTADLNLTWDDPINNITCGESINYTFIASLCGSQPDHIRRPLFQNSNSFPHLNGCEWSVTGGPTDDYNCIAWSADIVSTFLNPWDIDRDYGNPPNGVFENIADMDAFYLAEKGWTPTASGPDDAEAMYYPLTEDWDFTTYPNNPPSGGGYHAARRQNCTCGAGKWIMYTSKCGEEEQIEHIWDKLNGPSYRYPDRFYK